jgi:hypothetical protein
MENKRYIVAVLCTESFEEARKLATRIAKKRRSCSSNRRSNRRG